MTTRREVRERVMQALYAFELGGGDAAHIIRTLLKPQLAEDEAGLRFAETLFLRVLDRREEADAIIATHTENWDLSRIALIDRLLLRMAITEMLAFEDIPPKVSINEAIEVAKRYSTEKSGKFINGILDAVLLDLQKNGRLKKSGRGLIGMETLRDRVAS
ncbi:transcription antitermination factor NusB [Rhodocaloribacter litoris]|uniref:transcription antitermination factor NusB n=1 Tax=Rhodocaloribacter litoris TaxID=2558931 RepID=UPI0014201E8A|nr:transcription antitermination factor NusB [Rhodocaloribacter litoris]QXD13745.1 transcription antitermination factor NusB [Rhodocaloribacter litoris]